MPGSPLNPASWPCVHTYDPGLSEAAHASGSLLHCLLILLGQVKQSVFDRLCGNSSKPKVTERGQSWPHRSVHFQKTFGTLRRLTGSINLPPYLLFRAFCHTLASLSPSFNLSSPQVWGKPNSLYSLFPPQRLRTPQPIRKHGRFPPTPPFP